MLYTVIKKNSYQDSINLMLLTNSINNLDGVTKCSIMMGTDANKDIFRNSGLMTKDAEAASPSDMVILVDTEDEAVVEKVLSESEKFLNDLAVKTEKSDFENVNSLDGALKHFLMPIWLSFPFQVNMEQMRLKKRWMLD